MKAIVLGASGGIGAALVDALAARGAAVTALSRRSNPPVDLEHPATIDAAAAALAGAAPFDRLWVATGLLHAPGVTPDKALRQLEAESLARLFQVNAIGPALVLRAFLPLMADDARLGLLSARVGSIGDNRLGGWIGYRASKAALNQVVRTVAIERARTHPQQRIVALHPGTVDTPLSAPFQRALRPGQLRTPAASADGLIAVLERVAAEDSGACIDADGQIVIP